MTRLILLLAVAALAVPAAAAAKGPSAATVSGPGDGGGISFGGGGGGGDPAAGTPLGNLTMAAGFFPGVFDQTPDPMQPSRPKGALGPKYTITYTVPGPN